jgi:hypothetical protein
VPGERRRGARAGTGQARKPFLRNHDFHVGRARFGTGTSAEEAAGICRYLQAGSKIVKIEELSCRDA